MLLENGKSVFVIAEAGVNHNGNLDMAKRLVDAAMDAGADAVKFQTFKADKLVTRNAAMARYQADNTGRNEGQHELLVRLELSWASHVAIKEYCDKAGILFLSTPFDDDSADMLERLAVPLYKISSGDLTNTPFLRHVGAKGKPVILSTGMATLGETEEGLHAVYSSGNRHVSLLHCTTNYPARLEDVNLRAMQTLKEAFKVKVGYSDHTEGIEIPLAAVAMGAGIIEKHFTLDKSLPGPDHKASLEPQELKRMVTCIRSIEIAFGDGVKAMRESERPIRDLVRKSIVAAKAIPQGHVFGEGDLEIKRPANGMEPRYYESIIGRVARNDIGVDQALQWTDLE